ncbi:MAG: GNAT family N-acetyltransferase [Alphaproteobacteria bacterium]|nr:GNAT family N-acetyltransferase [Alphaproteobacteria bacterium]
MSSIDRPAPSAPIRPVGASDTTWIGDFLRERWGATKVVVHGEVIDAAQLPALVAEPRRGLATYRRLGGDAELVTLDAEPTRSGTGTALIEALTRKLSAEGCTRLWLTMTNGNLAALQFYLGRGFRLSQVRSGAADRARKLKPSIPLVGEHRIPIHDELDLCRVLDPGAGEITMPPWSEPCSDPVAAARQGYAEELRFTAPIRDAAVVRAFATVPREHFLGPGPWRILSPMRSAEYWTTENADPRHVYHDVLVAIDERGRLNNGQPSLWACLYDQLGLTPGTHVVHVGAGTGYYSAILAEIVGPAGAVTAIEIDPVLASQATDNLALAWPQARVVAADGFAFRPERPADAVIVNAGVTHFSPVWLDSLAAGNGRLLVPLTNAERWGGFLLITRRAGETQRYSARFVHHVGIIHCIGGRDPQAEARLTEALAKAPLAAVKSLRRAPEEPDTSCWLSGDGWWLSVAPVFESDATGLRDV